MLEGVSTNTLTNNYKAILEIATKVMEVQSYDDSTNDIINRIGKAINREKDLRPRTQYRNDFHRAILRAYADTFITNIEEGTVNEAVSSDCIAKVFKTFMFSEKQSNSVLNSLISGLSQVFVNLKLDSLVAVSNGLAFRRLPQADVFAEIGNQIVDNIKQNGK